MLTGREGDTFTVVDGDKKIPSRNIVGIIEGYDPELREDYIVVGAHIDNMGVNTVIRDGVKTTQIMPGADANASGVAALIECAKFLVNNAIWLRRSVIIVGFGAREVEFAGSRYFAGGGGFNQISNCSLMINLDMLGRGDERNPFQIYTLQPFSVMKQIMADVRERESYTISPTLYQGVIFSSDQLAFEKEDIPTITFSTGVSREYHTVYDTPDLISYKNLSGEVIYIGAFIKTIAADERFVIDEQRWVEDDDIYSLSDVDKSPQFFYREPEFFLSNWVYKYIKYPQEAVNRGEQGVLEVSFIVERNGKLSNIEITKSLFPLLDEEVLKIVSASPKWQPAMIGKKRVRTRITMPVEYRLKAN